MEQKCVYSPVLHVRAHALTHPYTIGPVTKSPLKMNCEGIIIRGEYNGCWFSSPKNAISN